MRDDQRGRHAAAGALAGVPTVARLRWICLALIGGPFLFGVAVAAWVLSQGAVLGDEGPDVLGAVAAAALLVLAPTAIVVRRVWWSRAARKADDARRLDFVIGTMVCFALLESVVLLNLVAWLLLGDLVPNALAAGIGLLVGVVCLPTQQQLEALGT